jgi:hypothetical protein
VRRLGPARWVIRVLERSTPERHRDAVAGDLLEEHELRTRSEASPAASRWYWSQVGRSVPRLLWATAKSGVWVATLGVGFAAWLAAGMVETAASVGISRLAAPGAGTRTILDLVVGLMTIGLAGYFAGRIRPGAAGALAMITVVSVALLMTMASRSAPLWYGTAFLVFGPLASVAGGACCSRRRASKGVNR